MKLYTDKKTNEQSKIAININLTTIILLLLGLSTMNAFNRNYFFVFIAFALFLISPGRSLRASALPASALLVLAISWAAFSADSAMTVFGILKPFSYFLCYLMGIGMSYKGLESSDEDVDYKGFYLLVSFVAFGSFAHYLINWIINAGTTVNRNTVDIWTGEVMSATGQAALACLPLALAAACLFSKNSKKIKIFAVISLVLILGYNLILSGRTLIILTPIILFAAFVHKLMTQKEGKMKVFIIFLVIVLLVVFVYEINLFGVKSTVESSPMYNRLFGKNAETDLGDGERTDRKVYYLQNMSRYWFGGGNLRAETGYAHDVFLDTYDEAGIFAFIAIIAYMLSTVVNLVKCVRSKYFPFEIKQIVLCVYLTLYIEFMIEPVMQGMPWLFAAFCAMDGYVRYMLNKSKELSQNPIVKGE